IQQDKVADAESAVQAERGGLPYPGQQRRIESLEAQLVDQRRILADLESKGPSDEQSVPPPEGIGQTPAGPADLLAATHHGTGKLPDKGADDHLASKELVVAQQRELAAAEDEGAQVRLDIVRKYTALIEAAEGKRSDAYRGQMSTLLGAERDLAKEQADL